MCVYSTWTSVYSSIRVTSIPVCLLRSSPSASISMCKTPTSCSANSCTTQRIFFPHSHQRFLFSHRWIVYLSHLKTSIHGCTARNVWPAYRWASEPVSGPYSTYIFWWKWPCNESPHRIGSAIMNFQASMLNLSLTPRCSSMQSFPFYSSLWLFSRSRTFDISARLHDSNARKLDRCIRKTFNCFVACTPMTSCTLSSSHFHLPLQSTSPYPKTEYAHPFKKLSIASLTTLGPSFIIFHIVWASSHTWLSPKLFDKN